MERRQYSPGTVTALPRKRRGGFGTYRLILLLGLLFIALFLVVIGFQSIQRHQLEQNLQRYQERIEEFEARNQAMEHEIERLQEADYLEYYARKYLGMVKPGETIFQLED